MSCLIVWATFVCEVCVVIGWSSVSLLVCSAAFDSENPRQGEVSPHMLPGPPSIMLH
jgi:hypothetical protein